MDLKRHPMDFKMKTRHSAHHHAINEGKGMDWVLRNSSISINTNPSVELHSALNVYKVRPSQTPTNFVGRKFIRPPPPSDLRYNARPISGVWRAEDHIPIMRTLPVVKQYSVAI